MEHAISVRGLGKSYGPVRVLDGVTFHVAPGETVGVVGENGAGKTTMVEIVSTLRSATEGDVQVLGMDARRDAKRIRARLGVLPEGFAPYRNLTVREGLRFFADLYPKARDVDDVLKEVGLEREADKLGGRLSAGNQRKLGVAAAVVHDPDLVILDEPTASLDPGARKAVRDLVARLQRERRTVVITSHDLSEIQAVADRVIIVHRGKVVAQGAPATIMKYYQGSWAVRIRTGRPAAVEDVLGRKGESHRNGLTVHATSFKEVGDILRRLETGLVEVESLEVSPPSLWEAYERSVKEAA